MRILPVLLLCFCGCTPAEVELKQELKQPSIVGQKFLLPMPADVAKDEISFEKQHRALIDGDHEACDRLRLRGDLIRLEKGSEVTVLTVLPKGVVIVRAQGNPDEFWMNSLSLRPITMGHEQGK